MNTEQKLVLSPALSRSPERSEGTVEGEAEGCDNCGEKLGPNPVRRGEKAYCCEACAFEAQRSVDCGGRSDSTTAPSVVEKLEK